MISGGEDVDDVEIAEGVLPPEIDEAAVPLELDTLSPWHKPRKQFIREVQWSARTDYLLQKITGSKLPLNTDGNREVRYLTLPGLDYFDVVELSKCCSNAGLTLTSTSFLAGNENSRFVARAQVREQSLINSGVISRHSQTFYRRFEEITVPTGSTYKEVTTRGPFQIVNIDACGAIAPLRPETSQRLIDAMHRLIEFQIANLSTRWLLFVTSDVRKETMSADSFSGLANAIVKNAMADSSFSNRAIQFLSPASTSINEAIKKAEKYSDQSFLQCFCLGLSKWIIHLAENKGWQVKVHKSYFYSTDTSLSGRATMPCLAYEFLPPNPGLEDQFKVSNAVPLPSTQQENLSIRALEKVIDMVDVDKLLDTDSQLASDMLAKTKNSLTQAGYAAEAVDSLK